jgi:trehalose 6-phosphate phosphatase
MSGGTFLIEAALLFTGAWNGTFWPLFRCHLIGMKQKFNDIPAQAVNELPEHSAPAFVPLLESCALLLDIDGTLLDLAATPSDVKVPKGLDKTLSELHSRTDGALALVSGRALEDIDRIFAPIRLPVVAGHGAEMRLSVDSEAVDVHAPPMDEDLKRRFVAIAQLSPGILLEDKGYSVALHYRMAPNFERTIYDAVSAIRAELPEAPIEVLPGKSVCEIKHSGFTKASGVTELMKHGPFAGRQPIFIGDDVTDESVFAIMPGMNGISFSVSRHARGVDGYFESPMDVRTWLVKLLGDEFRE